MLYNTANYVFFALLLALADRGWRLHREEFSACPGIFERDESTIPTKLDEKAKSDIRSIINNAIVAGVTIGIGLVGPVWSRLLDLAWPPPTTVGVYLGTVTVAAANSTSTAAVAM